jgi:hypothetical protein
VKPRVFVSSTFYDLRQIRDGLRRFLDELGYLPLLSEHLSFPVDPTEPTVENCKLQVDREADIFVLIVGRRYGSLDKATHRSVTNLEYLAARAKKIPIYAFIDKRIEPLIERWSRCPDDDFTADVDSTEVLRFAQQVRAADAVWTFPFETESDVIETLRGQFAHLMSKGLDWWRRLHSSPDMASLETLNGRSLRVALEQPPFWEFLLLAQVLEDEVVTLRQLRDEHMDDLALDLGEDVADPPAWAKYRLTELARLTHSLGPLMDVCANRAVGAPGVGGSARDLIFVGRAIGRVYASVLRWSRRVRTANLPEEFRPVLEVYAKFTNDIVGEIEEYGSRVRAGIERVLSLAASETPQQLDLGLKINLSEELVAEFSRALASAARIYLTRQHRR